ncbi:unnamed protein product [Phytophthora fragariaefolia]|uniref:Unnamed protein product n=1 Tax=Phytophthora fragariaefolia TaxID=1490495 RepID=A0A9W6XLS8_9STRA|nr:unnamed protein product [Phytophthora fragariaefolia]
MVDAVAATGADEVAGTVARIVTTVVAEAGPDTVSRAYLEKPKRNETAATRRRVILEADNKDGNGVNKLDAFNITLLTVSIVQHNTNIRLCVLEQAISSSADYERSDEDLDLREEAEDDEDDDIGSWEED